MAKHPRSVPYRDLGFFSGKPSGGGGPAREEGSPLHALWLTLGSRGAFLRPLPGGQAPAAAPLPFPGGGPGRLSMHLSNRNVPSDPSLASPRVSEKVLFFQTAAPRPSGNKWSLIRSVCGLKSRGLGGCFRKRSLWEPLPRACVRRTFIFAGRIRPGPGMRRDGRGKGSGRS